MLKRSYTQRDTNCDRVFGGKYLVEAKKIGILVSTCQDGNMDPRFSEDALDNYQAFLEKYNLNAESSFSPALGQNYRIITIDESNEEKFAGRFIENGDSREKYHCDAVIVCSASIPVAFRIGDCPVVLIIGQSFKEQVIMALVHAGRAELQADILKTTVGRMVTDHRILLRSGTAYAFPHICKHCYKLEYVDEATKEKAEHFLTFTDGYYHLDLMEWIKQQLKEAGIQRISTAFFRCTAGISAVCESRLLHDMKKFKGLFSHYKSFHHESPEGRFIVVVRIIEKDDEGDEGEGNLCEI